MSKPFNFAAMACSCLAFFLTVTAQADSTRSVRKGSSIPIPDVGPSSLYPSVITFSGMSGTIIKVKVLLQDFRHTYPNDVDILLVGPGGQRSILMSDVGGGLPGVSGPDITFDQVEGTDLPDNGPLVHRAVYLPKNVETVPNDDFPAPGPGLLVAEPANLDVFNGTDPNGEWKLYVVDDTTGDGGTISDGWRLTITDDTFITVTNTTDIDNGTCDADCSLREAIIAANANGSDPDDIVFDPAVFATPQTINLTGPLYDVGSAVNLIGPGADLLTVRRDTGGDYRIFFFGYDAIVSGMTISNGNMITNDFLSGGGGIHARGHLTLSDVHVINNHAVHGGGVYLFLNGSDFSDSTFSGNSASGQGGGVYMEHGDADFSGSTFSGNTAAGGGGVYMYEGNADFSGSTFSGNSAGGTGGGIVFEGRGGTLRLSNSTISGNEAAIASGIYITSYFCCNDTLAFITHSTIAHNTGGGDGILVYSDETDSTTTMTLANSIVAHHEGADLATATSNAGIATIISLGFNLTSDDGGGFLTGPADQVLTDPLLDPLANNGGPTPTHALQWGSLALDAGDSFAFGNDQRGLPRPFDIPGIASGVGDSADIGAVEMQALIVTNDLDTGDGTCDADCTLRDALTVANGNGAGQDDIRFDGEFFATARTINLTGALPAITSSLNLTGPGAGRLTVRRDSGGDYGIFDIFAPGQNIAMSGVTISNGLAGNGGGISSYGDLSLNGVVIHNNQASGGGGVYLQGSGNVVNSTISNNVVTGPAGGILFAGPAGSLLRIVNSTISHNSAGISSNGIFVTAGNSAVGGAVELQLINSTVANNTGAYAGIYVDVSQVGKVASVTLVNSVVANNEFPNLSVFAVAGSTATISSLGYNLTSDDGNGFLTGPGDQIDTDPLLGPLAENGGPTMTHALLAGSPALDQGNSSGVATDQRGLPRPFDISSIAAAPGGDFADIGAVEMQALIVTNDLDTGDGTCDADCTLRDALTVANGNGAGQDDILFDAGFFAPARTINLTGALPYITSSLNLLGTGASRLTVRRDSGGDYRIFSIYASGLNIAMSGVTISNGLGTGGGGIRSVSDLSLTGLVIRDNQAPSGAGVWLNASGNIVNSTISNNVATSTFGGISFSGPAGSLLRIVNSTISDNSAGFLGSSIGVTAGNAAGGAVELQLINSTVANNSGASPSIYIDVGQVGTVASATLINSVVAGNALPNLQTFAVAGSTATFNSLGYNLANDSGSGFLTGPGDQIDTDPLLGPLADNGGPTPTHMLLDGSPALDAGSCAFSGAGKDQRGYARPYDLPGTANTGDGCDIGAVEWSDWNSDGFDDGAVYLHSGFE